MARWLAAADTASLNLLFKKHLLMLICQTFSVLLTFFCVMAMHPEFQAKAQCELDEIVGPTRLPEYEDFGTLPYVRAIQLECLRWLPVVPIGVPHRALVDDHYGGYFIPRGTVSLPVRVLLL